MQQKQKNASACGPTLCEDFFSSASAGRPACVGATLCFSQHARRWHHRNLALPSSVPAFNLCKVATLLTLLLCDLLRGGGGRATSWRWEELRVRAVCCYNQSMAKLGETQTQAEIETAGPRKLKIWIPELCAKNNIQYGISFPVMMADRMMDWIKIGPCAPRLQSGRNCDCDTEHCGTLKLMQTDKTIIASEQSSIPVAFYAFRRGRCPP